jgi:hypothetical protein
MWTRGLARSTSSGGPTWPLWTAAALWGCFAIGAFLMLGEVRSEQALQAADLDWLRETDALSEGLAQVSVHGPRAAAPPPEPVPPWLLDELDRRHGLARVPLPPDAAADARHEWDVNAPLVRQGLPAAGPGARPLPASVVPLLATLRSAVVEVRAAVRARQAEGQARLASLWTRLVALGSACVLGVAVLCVALLRRHVHAGALSESQAAHAESEARFRTAAGPS